MIIVADVKWIKITTDMFDDEKIDFITSLPEADAIIVIWIRLLSLAGKCNAGGYIYLTEKIPYTEDMLSHKFRKPINIIKLALDTLVRLGMIEYVNDVIFIPNWGKHQNIDGMEKIREQTRIRTANYRQKLKQLPSSDATCDATVTVGNAIELDIDKELDKEVLRGKKFKPPTFEEVKTYCIERKNNVDADKWINHYMSNGWMVGKNKMKDWKAAVRTWERNSKEPEKPKEKGPTILW